MNPSVLTRPLRAAALVACLVTFHARAADPSAPPPDLRTLLQQALFEEEASRDLEKAAGGYEKLLSTWSEQRRYAASALFRLAEVRRKQDRKDDAVKLYQRLLTEFPDQDPETRLSRENLAALGAKAPAATPPSPGERMDPEEEKELGRLMVVAENSPSHLLDMVPWPEAGSPGDTLGVLANAARKGWIRVATWLLDHGANPNESTRATPLYHAVEKGNLAMCVLLFSRGARPESALGALTKAISDNQTGIADLLLSKGVDVNRASTVYLDLANRHGWMTIPPLVAAIAGGNRAWVDRLLQAKADVNVKVDNNFTPLHAACWREDAVLVKRLLEAGARPDVPDDLGNSLDDGQTMDSLRHGIRGNGWTPLHYAAHSAACVKELLSRGAKPDMKDAQGLSPLHVACYLGKEESARLLLAAGADPNASGIVRRQPNSSPSYIGGTAFSLAIRYAPGTLTEAMLKAGAKGDIADEDGATPFHLAVGYANLPAVTAMLAAGFPADTPDKAGSTPLLTALRAEKDLTVSTAPVGEKGDKARRDALTKSGAIVDLLLKAGADPERTLPDKTSVYLAATPARLRAFTRDLIYPKLAASRAIHLVGPGSRTERLAAPEREGEAPPPLADALVGFDESQRVSAGNPGQYKTGLQFSGLTIWRKKADGKMEPLAVDTAGDGPLPAMQWGDVIELSSETGKVPEDPLLPLRTRMERRVTVQMGEMKQEFTLRGRVRAYDPSQAEAPLVSTSTLLNLLGAGHPDFADATVEVRHSEAKGGGAWSWPLASGTSALPEDGDVITVKRGDPVKSTDLRRNKIVLTVPGKMMAWQLPGGDLEPTLMQFFAEVYGPSFRPVELAFSDAKSLADVAAKIQTMTPQELAAKLWRANAPVAGRAVITWPDWAHVKVRRLSGSGEETISVNVAEAMAALKPETTREDLKAVLMPLKPGDIVELPVQGDHPPGPWPGLDVAAVRLFQKALEAKVTLVEENGRFREVTASWIPPRWVDTPAGLLAIPDVALAGGRVRSLRASELVESIAPGMQVSEHIRDGKKSAVSNQSEDSPEVCFLSSGDILHIKWPPKISAPGVNSQAQPYIPGQNSQQQPQPRRRVVLPTQQ